MTFTKPFHLIKRCLHLCGIALVVSPLYASPSYSETKAENEPTLSIDLAVPAINASPYHRPFVAVWLEDVNRKPIKTLAVWYDDETWLKDMRQWWRKLGRQIHNSQGFDGLSGATQKPGNYSVAWDGRDSKGEKVDLNEVLLNIEMVREEGDRTYIRQSVILTKDTAGNTIIIPADGEIGQATIQLAKTYN
jgi:hypothetical protein